MDPRIARAFSNGSILPPAPDQPDLVHLTRAVASLAGVRRFDATSPPVAQISKTIGAPKHVVFALLDGLGLNLIDRLPPSSFLASHMRMRLRATAPSTTACALTSIATGEWPAAHGVTGWYTHVPEKGITVTTLHMVERFSGETIETRGISVSEILPVAAFHGEMSATPLTLLPASIADTTYARYSRGNTTFSPYDSLPNAAEQILEFVHGTKGPTHTHWYVPDIDSACHLSGLTDPTTMTLLLGLDDLFARLSRSLPNDARLVITADHGLVDVPYEGHLPLTGEDALSSFLQAPPSGDGRMPIFHVRPGAKHDFERAFRDHFGDGFAPLDTAEAEAIGLFGPGKLSPSTRRRFGDCVGIALGPVLLHYETRRSPPPQRVYRAQHAGLTPDELLIPLIVA